MKDLTTPKESEKDTELYLTRKVLSLGGQSYKWVSPGRAGVPDRICFFKSGLVVMVEVKSQGLNPTPLQAHVIEQLHDLGHSVFVVDCKDRVDALITLIRSKLDEKH